MRIFDTDVQKLKYMVLREVARRAFEDRLIDCLPEIPQLIAPGPRATMRCCVYKERAIASERVLIAMGRDKGDAHVIQIISIACDECPVSTYRVGEDCRGCLAHRCAAACPRDAISFDESQKAYIDPDRCVECGKCATVCPYSAIHNRKRPCEKACKVKAISRDSDKIASIDRDKCTACGECVYQCPFGAVVDRSFIVEAVRLLRAGGEDPNIRTYAVIAPSISSQFRYARMGQVIAALKRLGFHGVVEAASGADQVAWDEARELNDKGFLLSSCCPAFVTYVKQAFGGLAEKLSDNPSPMAMAGARIKAADPGARVVFIGPCTAKKAEMRSESVRPFVDCVLTFEELQALIDSRDIDMARLEEEPLDEASYYGRIFARSGGLTNAVGQALREQGIDFALKGVVADGIEECRQALLKASRGVAAGNFIEGMACVGGCVGGAGCLTHGVKDAGQIDRYGREATSDTIGGAIAAVQRKNREE